MLVNHHQLTGALIIITQQATQQLSTLVDFIRWTFTQFNQSSLFYGHGTENSWDEALALVLNTLDIPLGYETHLLNAKILESEKQLIVDRVKQRIEQRLPLPYITHKSWFAGLEFYVDKHVLIPRSPVAELIESQFIAWLAPGQINRIMDLCTGSGCIAIACEHYLPWAEVDAIDISTEALKVAQKNIEKHHAHVNLITSDLFNHVPKQPYDIIISNPPYVDQQDMDNLPAEFRHEPKMALAAGQDGLDCVRTILKQAANYLSEHGLLIVEVGNSQQALMDLLPQIEFLWLEFERGGEGVFVLTAEQLKQYQSDFDKL